MTDPEIAEEVATESLLRRLFDLFAVAAFVGLTYALSAATTSPNPLQILFGIPGLLFAPGYVTFVAVLQFSDAQIDIGPLEWVLLSFITSVSLIPLTGVLTHFLGVEAGPAMITLLIGGYTLTAVAVTVTHRLAFDPATVGLRLDDGHALVRGAFKPQSKVDGVLNFLVLLVLVAGAVAVAGPAPDQGPPQYTEFSLLTRNETGNLSAEGYFSAMNSNDPVYAEISNREHQPKNYTVIVQIQRAIPRNRSVVVTDRREVSRHNVSLLYNQTARIVYKFRTNSKQTGCRITFLLFQGKVPQSPTIDNAYREVHLWHTPTPRDTDIRCTSLRALEVTGNKSG